MHALATICARPSIGPGDRLDERGGLMQFELAQLLPPCWSPVGRPGVGCIFWLRHRGGEGDNGDLLTAPRTQSRRSGWADWDSNGAWLGSWSGFSDVKFTSSDRWSLNSCCRHSLSTHPFKPEPWYGLNRSRPLNKNRKHSSILFHRTLWRRVWPFLSRVSTLTSGIDIANLYVCLSVRCVPVFYGNGLRYC